MVYDIITFNGEYDLFEIRYNALKDIVDEFIVVEAPTTFAGHPKFIYGTSKGPFDEPLSSWPKVRHCVIDEKYSEEEIKQAQESKYTGGVPRWIWEYLQKESLSKFMSHIKNDDIVYVGDVDELWAHKEPQGIEKLKLRVYTYFLNLTSTEEFWGPIRAYYRDIKGKCLNDVRNNTEYRTEDYQGWHFTNQGGLDAVRQKVFDQYNPEVFGNETYYSLPDRFGHQDYIGRDFKLVVDESNWPEYLAIHREKYIHLLK